VNAEKKTLRLTERFSPRSSIYDVELTFTPDPPRVLFGGRVEMNGHRSRGSKGCMLEDSQPDYDAHWALEGPSRAHGRRLAPRFFRKPGPRETPPAPPRKRSTGVLGLCGTVLGSVGMALHHKLLPRSLGGFV